MAKSYTSRFAGINVTGLTDMILFTVPAGRTWVLRDIAAFINTAGAYLTLSIETGTASFAICFLIGDAALWRHVELRQAMNAGDKLRLSVSAGNAQLAITGYDLSAV